jgi:hypothetical protein
MPSISGSSDNHPENLKHIMAVDKCMYDVPPREIPSDRAAYIYVWDPFTRTKT